MNAVQTRHMKLWFAGKAFNWELATYELRLGPGSRSLRSLVRDDRNTTARRGFNFQTAKRIASASGYPVRRSGAIDYQRLWNTGSSAFADDDNGMRHSPRPACGERSRASCERVRGILDRLELADSPPHPDTSLRSVSDLSPQAGRGEASPWFAHTPPHSRGVKRPSCAGIFRPETREGVGNAGCPMHPQSRVQNGSKHTR